MQCCVVCCNVVWANLALFGTGKGSLASFRRLCLFSSVFRGIYLDPIITALSRVRCARSQRSRGGKKEREERRKGWRQTRTEPSCQDATHHLTFDCCGMPHTLQSEQSKHRMCKCDRLHMHVQRNRRKNTYICCAQTCNNTLAYRECMHACTHATAHTHTHITKDSRCTAGHSADASRTYAAPSAPALIYASPSPFPLSPS